MTLLACRSDGAGRDVCRACLQLAGHDSYRVNGNAPSSC
jgi:hypothetical protein